MVVEAMQAMESHGHSKYIRATDLLLFVAITKVGSRLVR